VLKRFGGALEGLFKMRLGFVDYVGCEMLSKSKSSSWSGGVSGGVSKGRSIPAAK